MKPCRHCPFVDSPNAYAYDTDAMEALDEGNEPACHAIVGTDAIFSYAPMTPAHPCAGYTEWANGNKGFRKPALVAKED